MNKQKQTKKEQKQRQKHNTKTQKHKIQNFFFKNIQNIKKQPKKEQHIKKQKYKTFFLIFCPRKLSLSSFYT